VDQALQDGHSLALSAQFPHWASWAEMTDTKLYLQQGLSEVAGQSVQIAVQEERIYPQLGGQGFSSLLGGVTTITILTMGVFLAPHLLVEERQSRTMDALLVSPASIAQIVASKASVGTLSCVASAAVALALYRAFVVHWAVAVLGALAGAFFAVMAGLVFGSFFRTLQGQSVAMGLGLALVAVLPFVADAALGRYPLFEAVAPWLPPIALFRLSHMALVGTVPVTSLWSSTGVLLGSGALALALLVWRVRRLGR
jgi:ABC-type transport system involved in multi-copper enzyme maturation permease subunit